MRILAVLAAVFAYVSLASPVCGDDKPLIVELWPGKVPDETGKIGPEKVVMSPKLDKKQVEVTQPTRMVTNVSKPSITIHRPGKDKSSREDYSVPMEQSGAVATAARR